MKLELRLLQRVHEIGGCDASTEYSRGWNEAVALCEKIIADIFGVGCDDVVSESSRGAVRDDPVNHPAHYCDGGIETLDFILAKKLDFLTSQVCKYISRAGKKDPDREVEDLKKARFYSDLKSNEGSSKIKV